jgi:hypothetical protein
MMFIISEINPVFDGNGRIAEVLMNAELAHGGQYKIIIPTVYKDDYLGALSILTKNLDPKPYVQMLNSAYIFIAFSSLLIIGILLAPSSYKPYLAMYYGFLFTIYESMAAFGSYTLGVRFIDDYPSYSKNMAWNFITSEQTPI